MPVFVEWRWQERTETFLLVFHFLDDFSRPNLRIKKYEKGKREVIINAPKRKIRNPREAWMTWAPSHVELGLVMELLSYANLINGLKKAERRKLKVQLEGREKVIVVRPRPSFDFVTHIVDPEEIKSKVGKDKKYVTYVDEPEKDLGLRSCVELCPEYIDYLKNLLKSYLK